MYVRKIDSDWNRHYKDNKLIDIPIINLDYDTLQEWALRIVRNKKLTKKQCYNMTLIIRQSLDYAVQKKLIAENPFLKVHVDGKLFQPKKKPVDKTQVFLTDEQPRIEAEAGDRQVYLSKTAKKFLLRLFPIISNMDIQTMTFCSSVKTDVFIQKVWTIVSENTATT